jgi:hypothetical protein
MLPRPLQQPHPPIWVGGNSRRALRRAVDLGDGWVPMPSPRRAARALHTPGIEGLDDLRDRIAQLREYAEQVGRSDPLEIVFTPPGLDMFGDPRAGSALDVLADLADLGVTWATVTLPGESRAALLEAIERFGADVLPAASRF